MQICPWYVRLKEANINLQLHQHPPAHQPQCHQQHPRQPGPRIRRHVRYTQAQASPAAAPNATPSPVSCDVAIQAVGPGSATEHWP